MKNLIKAIQQKNEEDKIRFAKDLKKEKNIQDKISSYAFYRHLFPKGSKKEFKSDKERKEYLILRYNKKQDAELVKKLERINTVASAGDFDKIVVNVEWKRSAMWGRNPSAEACVDSKDGHRGRYESGSIGGCGYDKESTAVANAVNQSNEFLKLLYMKKDKNIKKGNADIFGYGAGYGILPYLEGGVGVSCFPRICEKIGYTFNRLSSGKTFDVFVIEKKK